MQSWNKSNTNRILQTTGSSTTKDYGGTPASSTECSGVKLQYGMCNISDEFTAGVGHSHTQHKLFSKVKDSCSQTVVCY